MTEPNLARFAQKETKALQRPKIAALPVSEVRLVWPNPFEYTKNSAAVGGPLRVCKRKLAERESAILPFADKRPRLLRVAKAP